MTDEQIIKALECCQSNDNKTCRRCYFRQDRYCRETMAGYALDLINRQKAEIERLGKESADKERAYNEEYILRKELQSENESLKEAIKELRREMSYMSSPNTIGDRHEMGCW